MEVISPATFKVCLELHPPQLCATSCSVSSAILLHLMLYFLLIHSHAYCPTIYLPHSKWNLCPASWESTTHRWIKKDTLSDHSNPRKQPIFIYFQMFAFQWAAILHHIADEEYPRSGKWCRIMIRIKWSWMPKVRVTEKKLEGPRYHPTLTQRICITISRSYF